MFPARKACSAFPGPPHSDSPAWSPSALPATISHWLKLYHIASEAWTSPCGSRMLPWRVPFPMRRFCFHNRRAELRRHCSLPVPVRKSDSESADPQPQGGPAWSPSVPPMTISHSQARFRTWSGDCSSPSGLQTLPWRALFPVRQSYFHSRCARRCPHCSSPAVKR